jgi:hypothetical protein
VGFDITVICDMLMCLVNVPDLMKKLDVPSRFKRPVVSDVGIKWFYFHGRIYAGLIDKIPRRLRLPNSTAPDLDVHICYARTKVVDGYMDSVSALFDVIAIKDIYTRYADSTSFQAILRDAVSLEPSRRSKRSEAQRAEFEAAWTAFPVAESSKQRCSLSDLYTYSADMRACALERERQKIEAAKDGFEMDPEDVARRVQPNVINWDLIMGLEEDNYRSGSSTFPAPSSESSGEETVIASNEHVEKGLDSIGASKKTELEPVTNALENISLSRDDAAEAEKKATEVV